MDQKSIAANTAAATSCFAEEAIAKDLKLLAKNCLFMSPALGGLL
jgi:hypothetical protein